MSKNIEANGSKTENDTGLSEERRQHCIEVAAYFIAEKNQSDHCCDVDNWLAAEAEVAQLMAEGKL
jgi:hypothetical protein